MAGFEDRLNKSRRAADLPQTPRHGGRPTADRVRPAPDGPDGLAADREVSGLAWSMLSKILAGILVYGGLGWLLDRWLGYDALFLPVGVVVGAAFSLYLVFVRLDRNPPAEGDH